MKCPNCKHELTIKASAVIPDNQKMSVKLTLKDGFIGAETLGDCIGNMSKTLKAVADGLHERVEVFVPSILFSNNEIRVDFVIVKLKENDNT